MTLTEIRALVRRDLRDEDAAAHRWSDAELDRAVAQAVSEYGLASPLPQTALLPTISGSREIDIAALSARVIVEAVEYPVDKYPRLFCPFSLCGDTIVFKDITPDGSNCRVYYGSLHTLDAAGTTIAERDMDFIVAGAAAYAVLSLSVFNLNRVSIGGNTTAADLFNWSQQRLNTFQKELARRHWRNRVSNCEFEVLTIPDLIRHHR